jgi:exodeoxyribonuclease-5
LSARNAHNLQLNQDLPLITLNRDQAEGVRRIKRWFRRETRHQQVFFVSGYAGSGKSTALRHAIDELGL